MGIKQGKRQIQKEYAEQKGRKRDEKEKNKREKNMMEWRRKTSKKDGGKQGTRIKNKSEVKAQGQNKGKENAE